MARAPVRVCDCGGWTDTWFAGGGRVTALAVEPGVEVLVETAPAGSDSGVTHLHAVDFGDSYPVPREGELPDIHPLLEAAIREVPPPAGLDVDVTVRSGVPPSCSTGTSGAIVVTLLAALDHLAGGRRTPAELHHLAYVVEADRAGRQTGVQDQACAATGGAVAVRIDPFPQATATRIALPAEARRELDERLLLVYLGVGHDSSDTHRQVIDRLTASGRTAPELAELRDCADAARVALEAGDLDAYAAVLRRNTEAQRSLHPDLVGPLHERVIAAAAALDVAGWKVNGAGGSGGSVALLCAPGTRPEVAAAMDSIGDGVRAIALQISERGVAVHETGSPSAAQSRDAGRSPGTPPSSVPATSASAD